MSDERQQEQPDWTPAFPGQRRPFAPGNLMSPTTHGAYSPRKVDPLAREFVELLLVDDDTPSYVKAAAYRAELWSLGRAEAQVQLITEWLAAKAEETSDGVGDLASESVRSAYLLLHRAESRAASSRTRLGLTPVSAARLGKHVAQGAAAQADVATAMAALHRLEQDGRLPAGVSLPDSSARGGDDQDDDESGYER